MSRIALVAMGVPSFVRARRHAGPGLRAAHLASALAADGHAVLLLCVCRDGEELGASTDATPAGIDLVFTDEQRLFGQALRHRLEAFAADAIVGVTVYAASLAVRLPVDVPLWADLFGDLLAEAQAKAARSGGDWSLVHFWSLLSPVLERGDRFSAVSVAHANAVIGQLGLAGRLAAATAGEALVEVIPCAVAAPARTATQRADDRARTRSELGIDDDALVALCSGGFNTWCDVEGLALALRHALAIESRMHVVVTGGAIPGHDEQSHARFLDLLGAAPRVHLLGWSDSQRLPSLYACADVGLNIERPLYERRLGAENRVVEWLAHGLPALTTARSEAGADLVRRGLAIAAPSDGDAVALARTLAGLTDRRAELAATGARGIAFAAEHLSYAVTAEPLLGWARSPVHAGDHDSGRLLRMGLLSHPQGSSEMLEAYVRELSMIELLRRGLRWTLRRALRLGGA